MQTQRQNYRYRGWRRSSDLTDLAHAGPCDLTRVMRAAVANEGGLDALLATVATIVETDVSTLQHLRVQIMYRLTKDS